jgi:type I restriction-modification system DNA methylase subunit
VFDFACGSGSLILNMRQKGNVDKIFAQEKNITTYNLARMNMLLHGVKNNHRNACRKKQFGRQANHRIYIPVFK